MTERYTFAGKVDSDGRRIRGSVQLTGQRTFRNGEYVEVDPAALLKADASGAVARFDHDPSKVLAKMANKTLTINRTADGFDYETAELPNVSYANDALELVGGGYTGGSSFEIDGIRSKFTTDPDTGIRVRRITSIKRLVDVSPVFDPAFASTAAAFSKEQDVDDETTPVEEAPKEPKPTFTEQPKSGKDEWAAFARDLGTDQIEATLDQLFESAKGDLHGEHLDRYEGFAIELQRRKREGAEVRARAERMEALHNLRLGRSPKSPESGLYESDEYAQAFGRYLKTGDRALMEQFAQSIAGTGPEGGYTVPEEFRDIITESQKAFGGIQQVAEVITTGDGRALPWPTNDDTANTAVIATEGSAPGSAGADLVFGEVALGAFSIAATGAGNAPLKVSWELLQDSAIDIAAFVGRKLGERLGRKSAAYYATGTGTTEPFGLLAKTPDSLSASTMFAALIEQSFLVDSAYRTGGNATWVMSDTTLAKVYGSVDQVGRPLFMPNAEASGAGRPAGLLLGYPVRLDQGAGELVAFGDIRAGFIIRRVRSIEVVVDPYNNTATRQTAYHAWMRTDSAVQDGAAYSVADYTSIDPDEIAGA